LSQPSSRGGTFCGIGVIRRLRMTLVYPQVLPKRTKR
jgi:hypothetical protein